jgi:hypothetical protein
MNKNLNSSNVKIWLHDNLKDKNRIKACSDNLDKVPKTKGIYFWFMKKDGYQALSSFINFSPMANTYSIQINKETYDLVYLGTAGTGKKGESNLRERLQWHIEQQHRESAINQKQSALSTLRTGIGAMLANDLILPNTEQSINSFFHNHMLVYWLSYSSNKIAIDSDETTIIKTLKPILNLKNNPNARKNAPINVTQVYKCRRKLVEQNTKLRLKK